MIIPVTSEVHKGPAVTHQQFFRSHLHGNKRHLSPPFFLFYSYKNTNLYNSELSCTVNFNLIYRILQDNEAFHINGKKNLYHSLTFSFPLVHRLTEVHQLRPLYAFPIHHLHDQHDKVSDLRKRTHVVLGT